MNFKERGLLTILIFALTISAMLSGAFGSIAGAAWTDHLNVNGDFRYRYENAEKEGSEERMRHRLRARLAVTGKITDSLAVKLRLATGSDDPVSTNQSLDGYFSTKGFHLDRAYIQWKTTETLTLNAGKLANPFFKPGKSELIWDSDLSPEGISAQFESDTSVKAYGNVAYLVIDERKSDKDDAYLFGGQFGIKIPIGEAKLNVAAGYYSYINQEGYEPFGDAAGNSVDDAGFYIMDFSNVEAFVELKTNLGSFPLGVYGHYAINTEADENDIGYQLGFSLGKVKESLSWQFSYSYKEIQADSVVGAFTDSDFIGGGTDGKGHEIQVALGLIENSKLCISYFINEIGLNGLSKDYDRLMIDLVFKF